MKGRLFAAVILAALLALSACGTTKGSPLSTPEPTLVSVSSPAEQRAELINKLIDSEKDGYDTSFFLFELRNREARDQLSQTIENFTKPLIIVFLDKNDNLIDVFPLSALVYKDRMIIPEPWSLYAGGAPSPEYYKEFKAVTVPEEIILGEDEAPQVNQKTGMYTFKLPDQIKRSPVPDFISGDVAKLKALDVVVVATSDGIFMRGAISFVKKDMSAFVITLQDNSVVGGGLVFALKNGLPALLGVLVNNFDGHNSVVLDIDVALNQ